MSDWYSDDPIEDNPVQSRGKKSLFLLALLVVSGFFVQTTLAANISVTQGQPVEFGQGVRMTTACSGSNSLVLTPLASFLNASGSGAFYLNAVKVSGVPSSCDGVDFTITAYGDSGNSPLAIFNTNSTSAVIYDNGANFELGIGTTTGASIASGSGTFTITFTNPVAASASVSRLAIQSGAHKVIVNGGSIQFAGESPVPGTQQHLSATIPTAINTGDFTWEAWVRPLSATTHFQTFFDTRPIQTGRSGNESGGVYFGTNSSTLYPMYYQNGVIMQSSIAITMNSWNHVALVRRSGTTKIYVNGQASATYLNDSLNFTARVVNIGGTADCDCLSFNGYITNMRMVNGVAVYTGNFSVPTAQLAATQASSTNIAAISSGTQLLLNAITGATLIDSSGNNLTVTNNNSATSSLLTPFSIG